MNFVAHISTVDQVQRPLNNEEVVVIVMPVEHNLPNLNQPKYKNRFHRVAKKAYIYGQLCWAIIIEIGNADFADLLPGLETSNILYVLFENKIVTRLNDPAEYLTNGIKSNSFPLKSYNQEQNDLFATYECRFGVKITYSLY